MGEDKRVRRVQTQDPCNFTVLCIAISAIVPLKGGYIFVCVEHTSWRYCLNIQSDQRRMKNHSSVSYGKAVDDLECV